MEKKGTVFLYFIKAGVLSIVGGAGSVLARQQLGYRLT